MPERENAQTGDPQYDRLMGRELPASAIRCLAAAATGAVERAKRDRRPHDQAADGGRQEA